MDYSSYTNEQLQPLIDQNDMEAVCEMAERYLHGNGAEQNLNKAYQLFHRAENQGSARAYQGLGYMYEHGILFAQNLDVAKDYYAKAGIYKTDFVPEKHRKSNAEKVAEAIARSESPTTVMVNADGTVTTTGPVDPSTPTVSVSSPTPVTPYASPTPQPAMSVPDAAAVYSSAPVQPVAPMPNGTDTQSYLQAAMNKAMEAAKAAEIASAKAREAAEAANQAAQYAQNALS